MDKIFKVLSMYVYDNSQHKGLNYHIIVETSSKEGAMVTLVGRGDGG